MYEYKVKSVTRVIDGDTIEVIVDLGFNVSIEATIRLWGINCPETRTRDLEEKAKGIKAKNFVQKHIEDAKKIKIRTLKDKTGSFSRMLGIIIVDNIDLNQRLLVTGHATKFKQ